VRREAFLYRTIPDPSGCRLVIRLTDAKYVPAAANWLEEGTIFFKGIESFATEFHPCGMLAPGANALDESSIQDGYQ
jgi:hypothetical protein